VVDVIRGNDLGNGETVFPTPAEEFELSRIHCREDQIYRSGKRCGPDTLIVMEGEVTAAAGVEKLHLTRGECFFVTQDTEYTLTGRSQDTVVFKASLPSAK
jgi:mannose-6-phosphate isomerase